MPLLWLSVAFVVGIGTGWYLKLPLAVWLSAGIFCLGLISLRLLPGRIKDALNQWAEPLRESLLRLNFLKWLFDFYQENFPKPPVPYSLLLVAFFFGAARITPLIWFDSPISGASPGSLAAYNDRGERFVVEGVMVTPPEVVDNHTDLRLQVERLHPVGRMRFVATEGVLQARFFEPVDWQYGDRLRLEGELETPPEFEGFSYRAYLARQGVSSLLAKASGERIGYGSGGWLKSWVWALRSPRLARDLPDFP